jgi:hypothetical protein
LHPVAEALPYTSLKCRNACHQRYPTSSCHVPRMSSVMQDCSKTISRSHVRATGFMHTAEAREPSNGTTLHLMMGRPRRRRPTPRCDECVPACVHVCLHACLRPCLLLCRLFARFLFAGVILLLAFLHACKS